MPLHIIALSIVGFKRISAIHIEPKTGKPILLAGDNAAGKSSVIDAIFFALTNNGVLNPIKHGESKCKVTLEIGNKEREFTIERTNTTKGGSGLVVKDANGAQVPKPQEFLNGIFSKCIDPVILLELDAKEQAEMLCNQLGLTAKMAEIDEAIDNLMEDRRVKNASLKSVTSRRDAIKPAGRDVPDELVDVAALTGELQKLGAEAREIDKVETAAKRAADLVGDRNRDLDALNEQLKHLQARVAEADALLIDARKAQVEADKKMKPLEKRKKEIASRTTVINEGVASANTINEDVRLKQERARLTQEMVETERAADALTAKIEEKRQSKIDLVKKAKLPLKGLSLGEDGLLYENVPLKDLNTASQIRVCAAIAMAETPKLPLLFIREAALCNKENLKIILDMAEEKGFQPIIERFQEADNGEGIFIEEGEIALIDGKKQK